MNNSEIKAFIGSEVKYDKGNAEIYLKDDEDFTLLSITDVPKDSLKHALGQWIADAINEKLKREKS